jgi:hypothetical protein
MPTSALRSLLAPRWWARFSSSPLEAHRVLFFGCLALRLNTDHRFGGAQVIMSFAMGKRGQAKLLSDGAVGRVTRLDRVYLICILLFTEQPNVVYERLEKIPAEWVPEYSTYKVQMHIKVKYCFTLVRL